VHDSLPSLRQLVEHAVQRTTDSIDLGLSQGHNAGCVIPATDTICDPNQLLQ
jgi:hypothetical protein